jgi:hypothetical protein
MGGGGYGVILERMLEDVHRAKRAEEAFDPETGLPRLPQGEPPFPAGIPGLPPYRCSAGGPAGCSDTEEPAEGPAQLPAQAADPSEPRVVYSAPAALRRVKKDKTDQKVDAFLCEIYKL